MYHGKLDYEYLQGENYSSRSKWSCCYFTILFKIARARAQLPPTHYAQETVIVLFSLSISTANGKRALPLWVSVDLGNANIACERCVPRERSDPDDFRSHGLR